jgi:hypothetical protein
MSSTSNNKRTTWADDSDDEKETTVIKNLTKSVVVIPPLRKSVNLIFSNWNSAIKDVDGIVPVKGVSTTVFSKNIRELVDKKEWRFSKWYGLQGGKKPKSNKKSRYIQFLYWYQTDKQREQFLYDIENGIDDNLLKSYYVYQDPSLETDVKKKVSKKSAKPSESSGKRPWEKIKS